MFPRFGRQQCESVDMTTRLNKYKSSVIMTELLYSVVLTKSLRLKVKRMKENQFEAVDISNSFKDFGLKTRVPKM